VLLLAGLTHPRGLVWLQTNWWISEEDHGFCRIDQNPITRRGRHEPLLKPVGFIPGQPAADKPDILSSRMCMCRTPPATARESSG